jgi:hypothetical protein
MTTLVTLRRLTVLVAATTVLALSGGTAGPASRTPGYAGGQASPDGALQGAHEVALVTAGGGEVADSEVAGDESHYEVEVLLSDGSTLEVHLDTQLAVVRTTADEPD